MKINLAKVVVELQYSESNILCKPKDFYYINFLMMKLAY